MVAVSRNRRQPTVGAAKRSTSRSSKCASRRASENRPADLVRRERSEPVERELLDREAREDAPEHDGAAHRRVVLAAAAREVPHEPTREAVAGAGRVEDGRERDRRRGEDLVAREEERPVLAPLDDHRARAEGEDPAGRLDDVVLLGELARLGVVHEQEIHPLQRPEQALALRRDPEVHGVARDEPRSADLVEHGPLQIGVDVAEKDVLRVAIMGGQLRVELGEHVELRVEGVRGVEVELVAALPAERAPGAADEPGEVDAARAEEARRAPPGSPRPPPPRRGSGRRSSSRRRSTTPSPRARRRASRTAFRGSRARPIRRRAAACGTFPSGAPPARCLRSAPLGTPSTLPWWERRGSRERRCARRGSRLRLPQSERGPGGARAPAASPPERVSPRTYWPREGSARVSPRLNGRRGRSPSVAHP